MCLCCGVVSVHTSAQVWSSESHLTTHSSSRARCVLVPLGATVKKVGWHTSCKTPAYGVQCEHLRSRLVSSPWRARLVAKRASNQPQERVAVPANMAAWRSSACMRRQPRPTWLVCSCASLAPVRVTPRRPGALTKRGLGLAAPLQALNKLRMLCLRHFSGPWGLLAGNQARTSACPLLA